MQHSNILRIIDANFNRAREALRVIEDILRFTQVDDEFISDLREIRHNFTAAYLKHFEISSLPFRNTKTDPGKANRPSAAKSIKQILLRNFFRAEEAMRCLEECSMVANPNSTRYWQQLRFAIYQIEQNLIIRIPEKAINAPFVGFLISDVPVRYIETIAEKCQSCKQSVIMVNPSGNIENFIRQLKKLKRKYEKTIFLVLNRPDVAMAADIDGVHLEYNSMSVSDARKLLPGKIIGIDFEKTRKLKKSEKQQISFVSCEGSSQISELLTKWQKNIKLYAAAILNSCQEIKKAFNNGADGVLVKIDAADDEKIAEALKIIRDINGKKA